MDGQTQLTGVMGWPIAHSLSPPMHNAAFEALGMNWCYVPMPVHPSQVGAAIEGLKALGFRGCNVTVPHKEAVIPHLDDIPPRVARFGAVNTLILRRDENGRCTVSGENTDVQGFVYALRQAGFDPEGWRVAIIGAGGAARGVIYALCGVGTTQVTVLNRTPQRGAALVDDLSAQAQGTELRSDALTLEMLQECAAEADLLVNATTVGMWPHMDTSIWPDDLSLPSRLAVCDLVYRPLETKLLRQAQPTGAPTIGGLGMLVEQAALSFEMWTGQRPPVDVMWAACEAVLRNEAKR